MTSLPFDRVKWPFAALGASLAMLATAHGFERFLHLAPCPLCYTQRQVYWAAAALAMVAVLLSSRGGASRLLFALSLILGFVFLTSAGVAGYHALIEWGVLPELEVCLAGAAELPEGSLWNELGKPQAVPACGDPQWIFLGLSMAGWNVLVSLMLAALSFLSAVRPSRTDTANESPPVS